MNTSEPLEIAVIGAGYVGLTTAACLAALGHRVTCVETDRVKLAALQGGRLPFYEPGLEGLVRVGVDASFRRASRASDLWQCSKVFALTRNFQGVEFT